MEYILNAIQIISQNLTAIIYVLIIAFLYRLFDEAQDRSMHSRWPEKYTWLNSESSWVYKWSFDDEGILIPFTPKWYYFGFECDYKERFFLSSTSLVFLTDGEHFFQFIKNRCKDFTLLVFAWWMPFVSWIGQSAFSFIKERFLKTWQ